MARSHPEGISLPSDNAAGGERVALIRLVVLAAILVVALFGWLGGGSSAKLSARSPKADLLIDAPTRMRNGNLFEMRLDVVVRTPIDDAVLAIPEPLWRDVTINSMIPAASEEETVDGEFRFHFGPLEPGDRLQYKLDGQLNPSLVGSIQGPIRLLDGDRVIVRHDYRLTVLP